MKTRFILLILILPSFLISCGQLLGDKTESLKKTENIEKILKKNDKGTNNYSGDPLDSIDAKASGNAVINITIGEKKPVEKNEKRDTQSDEEIKASFSVDHYISQVSLAGWILIILAVIALIVTVWVFIHTTATGKATDRLLGGQIERVNTKLHQANTKTNTHARLQSEMADLLEQRLKNQGGFLKKIFSKH